MVNITFKSGGGKYRLEMEGHATKNPAVCAACSALAYTFLGWAANADLIGKARLRDVEDKQGYMRLEFESEAPEAETVSEAIMLGFLQIEQAHPELVSITEERENAS